MTSFLFFILIGIDRFIRIIWVVFILFYIKKITTFAALFLKKESVMGN